MSTKFPEGRSQYQPAGNGAGTIHLSPEQLDELRPFDTCTLANAIETFNIRLRNEGYTSPGLRCVNGKFPAILGYAATCRVKSSNPPMTGNYYYDRTDWWSVIQSLPRPRVAVIEDVDSAPGTGASVGEVHAAILKALDCIGAVTNGAVRDLPAVAALNFPMFACHVSVSHAYVHMIDYGGPVTISGLQIGSGDLIMADCHGVLSIPSVVAPELARVARELTEKERRVIDLCQSPAFSIENLRAAIESL
jgi:4-hydroxy-4-methyl-2-oxoglutarate aldolase